MTEPLSKVDSAVGGLSQSPPKEHKTRRQSSAAAPACTTSRTLVRHSVDPALGEQWTARVFRDMANMLCLVTEEQKIELELAPETQRTGWKINTSSSTVEDKDILKLPLSKPPVKKIDLHFPLGMEVTARNLKGVTIKDALDAIHKAYKKRADDELDKPYLAGFEWDKEESWTRLVVHLQKQPATGGSNFSGGGGKKKKNKKAEGEE
ncbi:hypothetical protein ColKHC_09802 [Colletotrichum higginsianum]|nr:hypothetical protein ColKHC_09802 [Colletotrichum higginsianum]